MMRNQHICRFCPIGALVIGIHFNKSTYVDFSLRTWHMFISQMLMSISQPLMGYWKGLIVVFSLVGLNLVEYQFQNKLTYVNFEIGISKIHPVSDWIRPILRMIEYSMSMLVVKIFKENLQKAFHRIIAPAETYAIFKSKRKLTMHNTTMLDLLLQCTLVVSETG